MPGVTADHFSHYTERILMRQSNWNQGFKLRKVKFNNDQKYKQN